MEKLLHSGKGYAVVELDGELKVTWEDGMGHLAYYDISEENFEKLKQSEKDAWERDMYEKKVFCGNSYSYNNNGYGMYKYCSRK